MTKEEIIELAREAEMGFDLTSRTFFAELERFANLVAAKERERCASVCDDYINRIHDLRDNDESLPAYQAELAGRQAGAGRCAEAIRSLK